MVEKSAEKAESRERAVNNKSKFKHQNKMNDFVLILTSDNEEEEEEEEEEAN